MKPVRRPRPATAALAALRLQSELIDFGFDIKTATKNYVNWFFKRTIPASLLQKDKKLSEIGINDTNLEILAHVFARHIIDHAEWNVDPDKLSSFSQAEFAADMKKKTLGECISYLVNLVESAQKT
jgi:hypothetical protein